MSRNPGRVAGLWYLSLVVIGLLTLVYIPDRLYVRGNPAATAENIASHELLFRLGMVMELVGAVFLIFLVLALYRLFKGVDQNLAMQVVIVGGIMQAVIGIIGVAIKAGALTAVSGADVLSAFDKPQRDALAAFFLRLRAHEDTAATILSGVWLFPLAILIYRSRFLPRFLGVWLAIGGVGWLILCLTGFLFPEYQGRVFLYLQPAAFGEIAFALWLVIKGAQPASWQEVRA